MKIQWHKVTWYSWTLAAIIFLVVVPMLVYYFLGQYKDIENIRAGISNTNDRVGAVACTMEAKQCPDGSYVGRSGPSCEFAQCPK